MKSNYKRIGDYTRLVDKRNRDLSIGVLLGLSIDKVFIPSVANTVGSNMANYKVIRKGQFACSLMQVRRDKKIPVAMLDEYEEAIISQAYPVFEIKNANELLPEYLMMWMSRSEFDRETCFYAIGGVRGSLEWEDFCNMKLPVPHIDKQRKIVQEYQAIVNRIKLNEKINQKLEETAQAIYKQWFIDFEFPISKEYAAKIGKPKLAGKPYKSSGGEMVWNDELEQEIPEGWESNELNAIATVKGGKRLPVGENLRKQKTSNPYIKVADMGDCKYTVLDHSFEYLTKEVQSKISRYTVQTNDLIISIVGTIGIVRIIHDSLHMANLTENCAKVTALKKVSPDYLYYFLNSPIGKNEIEMRTVGGVQGKLPLYNIYSLRIIIPNLKVMASFSQLIKPLSNNQKCYLNENVLLKEFRKTILSKMTKAEVAA